MKKRLGSVRWNMTKKLRARRSSHLKRHLLGHCLLLFFRLKENTGRSKSTKKRSRSFRRRYLSSGRKRKSGRLRLNRIRRALKRGRRGFRSRER